LKAVALHASLFADPGFRPKSLPAVPGLEGTGFVKSVGEGVSKLRVGQRVVPFLGAGDKHTVAGNGSWQDEVVISADACFPVPDDVSDDAAAQVSGVWGTVRGIAGFWKWKPAARAAGHVMRPASPCGDLQRSCPSIYFLERPHPALSAL
jgi:NADPH:quinone reductase-like Zn-dependent oxidoreductase